MMLGNRKVSTIAVVVEITLDAPSHKLNIPNIAIEAWAYFESKAVEEIEKEGDATSKSK